MYVDLGKYHKFFKILLEEIFVKCAKQKIYIVELRHIVGLVFDDDRKALSLYDELAIFDEILLKVRRDLNLSEKEFHLKLIISGLKIIG